MSLDNKQSVTKFWTGHADLAAEKDFDSVQEAAEANSPDDTASVKCLSLHWGNSNIKLKRRTMEFDPKRMEQLKLKKVKEEQLMIKYKILYKKKADSLIKLSDSILKEEDKRLSIST